MGTRFLEILSKFNKIFKNLVKWQQEFRKLSSNGNKIFKSLIKQQQNFEI